MTNPLLTASFEATQDNQEALRMLVHPTDSAARWAGEQMLKDWFNEEVMPRLKTLAKELNP